uniref:WD repeat-containing protein 34 n=2 Tax=Magallana gigas TaxID=29159 RepID=A0A8W8IMP9_MAGGI
MVRVFVFGIEITEITNNIPNVNNKMFADITLESVTFKSNWKKERSLASSGCQTSELVVEEVACQSVKYKSVKTQTEDDSDKFSGFADDNSGHLAEFLRRVEPAMHKQLEMNVKSHAFDDYEVTWDEGSSTMSSIHKLTNAAHDGQFQITGLSWNSTGAVIAASYGRFDHEDWCTHKTSLCTWNLERRNLDENKPDTVLEVSSCLMCTAFHPSNPALIAGGTYNGVVIVWDLSREDDMVLTSSGIGDDSHREPVSKVIWVPDTSSLKKNKYLLVSVSSDGKMLVWKMDRKTKQIELHDGFVLMNMNLPTQLRKSRTMRGDKEVGVTCISYNNENKDSFIIGSEPGAVFKCSMSANGEQPAGNIISSIQLKSPVTFTYAHHYGPVYSAEFSPFHRNAFLTSSMDQTLRLYSMLQKQPIMTLEPGEGVIYSTKWSFSRPALFAATTDTGLLLLYDLTQNQPVPVYKLEAGGLMGNNARAPVLTCQFNQHQNNLIATGDAMGCIQVFRISDSLKTPLSRDLEILGELVDITTES